jgi:hypothetical protein
MCRFRKERIGTVRTAFCEHESLDGPEEPGRVIRRPQPQADEVEAGSRNGSQSGELLNLTSHI